MEDVMPNNNKNEAITEHKKHVTSIDKQISHSKILIKICGSEIAHQSHQFNTNSRVQISNHESTQQQLGLDLELRNAVIKHQHEILSKHGLLEETADWYQQFLLTVREPEQKFTLTFSKETDIVGKNISDEVTASHEPDDITTQASSVSPSISETDNWIDSNHSSIYCSTPVSSSPNVLRSQYKLSLESLAMLSDSNPNDATNAPRAASSPSPTNYNRKIRHFRKHRFGGSNIKANLLEQLKTFPRFTTTSVLGSQDNGSDMHSHTQSQYDDSILSSSLNDTDSYLSCQISANSLNDFSEEKQVAKLRDRENLSFLPSINSRTLLPCADEFVVEPFGVATARFRPYSVVSRARHNMYIPHKLKKISAAVHDVDSISEDQAVNVCSQNLKEAASTSSAGSLIPLKTIVRSNTSNAKRDLNQIDTSTTLLKREVPTPSILIPMSSLRQFHSQIRVARGRQQPKLPVLPSNSHLLNPSHGTRESRSNDPKRQNQPQLDKSIKFDSPSCLQSHSSNNNFTSQPEANDTTFTPVIKCNMDNDTINSKIVSDCESILEFKRRLKSLPPTYSRSNKGSHLSRIPKLLTNNSQQTQNIGPFRVITDI